MLRVTFELTAPSPVLVARMVVVDSGEGLDEKHPCFAAELRDGGLSSRRVSVGMMRRSQATPLGLAAAGLFALGYMAPEHTAQHREDVVRARVRAAFLALGQSEARAEALTADAFRAGDDR